MSRERIRTALFLAMLAMMLTLNSALAHAGHEESMMDRIVDSALIPVIGVAALAVVSLSWWRVRGKYQE